MILIGVMRRKLVCKNRNEAENQDQNQAHNELFAVQNTAQHDFSLHNTRLLYTSRIRGSMNVMAMSTMRLTRENIAAVTISVDWTKG